MTESNKKTSLFLLYKKYIKSDADLLDPLHEDEDSPVPGLTHRYPDRVLLLITDMCSMYCRHCTRRRFAGSSDDAMPMDRIDKAIEYIAKTPQVRDVFVIRRRCTSSFW